jgi:carbamoyltransferase
MGAAAYGELNKKLKDFFCQRIKALQPIYRRGISDAIIGKDKLRLKLVPSDFSKKNEKDYFSYCCALQKATETAFEDYFKELLSIKDSKNVCLAGGTVLNCIGIGKIFKEYPDLDFYFCPAVNDGGLTIGTCLWAYYQVLGKERIPKKECQTPYLGFARESYDYEKLFKKFDNINIRKKVSISEIADLITDGNIISLFNGRSESGRRALGNRSIVCDPRDKDMKQKINKKVKHRHWYRPFAPSVLREKVKDVFESDVESPYMSLAIPIKKEWRKKIPAVNHIDGTSRLQTVTKDLNPLYYDLINEFYFKTQVPLVLNTSFNDNEPIVETPEDALKCFLGTEIDYLYMEGCLISKK